MTAMRMASDAHPPINLVLLHIGKTGGTALRTMLGTSGTERVILLRHKSDIVEAADLYPEAKLGFFVRDPMSRMISGFLSRLRKGMPRHNSPWSADEAQAFGRYPTLEALGRGLAEDDAAAFAASDAILHVLAWYLGNTKTLEGLRDRIAFIGQQETYDQDIERLKLLTGLAHTVFPPRDDIGAHRNPEPRQTVLSVTATAGLRRLLVADEPVYRWCLDWREAAYACALNGLTSPQKVQS